MINYLTWSITHVESIKIHHNEFLLNCLTPHKMLVPNLHTQKKKIQAAFVQPHLHWTLNPNERTSHTFSFPLRLSTCLIQKKKKKKLQSSSQFTWTGTSRPSVNNAKEYYFLALFLGLFIGTCLCMCCASEATKRQKVLRIIPERPDGRPHCAGNMVWLHWLHDPTSFDERALAQKKQFTKLTRGNNLVLDQHQITYTHFLYWPSLNCICSSLRKMQNVKTLLQIKKKKWWHPQKLDTIQNDQNHWK